MLKPCRLLFSKQAEWIEVETHQFIFTNTVILFAFIPLSLLQRNWLSIIYMQWALYTLCCGINFTVTFAEVIDSSCRNVIKWLFSLQFREDTAISLMEINKWSITAVHSIFYSNTPDTEHIVLKLTYISLSHIPYIHICVPINMHFSWFERKSNTHTASFSNKRWFRGTIGNEKSFPIENIFLWNSAEKKQICLWCNRLQHFVIPYNYINFSSSIMKCHMALMWKCTNRWVGHF